MLFFVFIAEKNIRFKVQHQCHQCGAPVALEEDTRYFICEFCRVRSCISQNSFPIYMFSPSPEAEKNEQLFYLPYWRFKGVRYTCSVSGVAYKFMDISRIALKNFSKKIPASLGLRSQAMPLNFISESTLGNFLSPERHYKSIIAADKQFQSTDKNFFQEDIGETLSLIYAPFYLKAGTLFDGILNTPVCAEDSCRSDFSRQPLCRPAEQIFFIPGLCPACGWNLEGHSDSLILACSNCETLWRAHGKKLAKIKFECAHPNRDSDVLLPFWKIRAEISNIDLTSAANLLKAPVTDGYLGDFSFWSPAFKIRPKIFLRLATQLDILQLKDMFEQKFNIQSLYPVNLLSQEAVESIRISLASLMKPARRYLSLLSESIITPKEIRLVYLPFESGTHELFHSQIGVSINKNSLKLAGNL